MTDVRGARFGMRIVPALVVCAGLAACGSAAERPATEDSVSDFPMSITNCDTVVEIERPPSRVLAIKSTSIEMMLALGQEERIAGIAFPDGPVAEDWAPDDELNVVSDRVPAQEATLALEPDLIYAGWESNVSADGVGARDDLARLGVPSLVSPAACQSAEQPDPLTWDHVWDEIALAGEVFDAVSNADALVAEQQKRLEAVEPDGRGLTALWYSSGSDTPFVGAGIGAPQLVMDTVGLTNIADDLQMTWASYSWEAVIDADPDVIVLIDSAWGSTDKKIDQLESNPATAALTAVREKRYLVVPFPAGEAGVRTVEAVETLHEQLGQLDFS